MIDAARRMGGLNVLVNNASELGSIGPLLTFDVPRFGRLFPVNVGAPTGADPAGNAATRRARRPDRQHHERRRDRSVSRVGPVWRDEGRIGAADSHARCRTARSRECRQFSSIPETCGPACIRRPFRIEDISDRPLPDVTVPFWTLAVRSGPQGYPRRTIRRPTGGRAMAAAGVIDAFTLPAHLEAAEPPEARGLERDDVRLLVSTIDTDAIRPLALQRIAAMAFARRPPGRQHQRNIEGGSRRADESGDAFELHLSTQMPGNFWVVEVRRPDPRRTSADHDARAGSRLELDDGGGINAARALPVYRRWPAQSRLWLAALQLPEPVLAYLERFGKPIRYGYVPASWPSSMYQTVFATEPGSAEMPSAGRPFTHDARHATRRSRSADRTVAAPHRRGEPGGSRAALRGVLPRDARDGGACQCSADAADIASSPSARQSCVRSRL